MCAGLVALADLRLAMEGVPGIRNSWKASFWFSLCIPYGNYGCVTRACVCAACTPCFAMFDQRESVLGSEDKFCCVYMLPEERLECGLTCFACLLFPPAAWASIAFHTWLTRRLVEMRFRIVTQRQINQNLACCDDDFSPHAICLACYCFPCALVQHAREFDARGRGNGFAMCLLPLDSPSCSLCFLAVLWILQSAQAARRTPSMPAARARALQRYSAKSKRSAHWSKATKRDSNRRHVTTKPHPNQSKPESKTPRHACKRERRSMHDWFMANARTYQ